MKYCKAKEDEAALRLGLKDAKVVYTNRGVAYECKGEYAKARRDFEQALRLDPNNSQARNNLEKLTRAGH